MGHYDTMQVCLKGHKITAYYNTQPSGRQNFCDVRGKKTITDCQSCHAKIRGKYHINGVISFNDSKPPTNCHNCGKAYPWGRRLGLKRKFKKSKWLKSLGKLLSNNLIKIIVPVTIAVITAFILFKMGIKQ